MAELIARIATLLQRKIQKGTGPNFLERARISLDGFKLLGSAQNFFRRLEASWIGSKTFPGAAKLLRSDPRLLDPSQTF